MGIDSFGFGYITIDGVTYWHDLFTPLDGSVKEREHTFTRDQMEYVLKERPEVVAIGNGTSGLASLSRDARGLLGREGVEMVEDDIQPIMEKFNKLSGKKRVAAIIHVSC